jgi:phenylalanyl-tRNA synthetase alpha subunit
VLCIDSVKIASRSASVRGLRIICFAQSLVGKIFDTANVPISTSLAVEFDALHKPQKHTAHTHAHTYEWYRHALMIVRALFGERDCGRARARLARAGIRAVVRVSVIGGERNCLQAEQGGLVIAAHAEPNSARVSSSGEPANACR